MIYNKGPYQTIPIFLTYKRLILYMDMNTVNHNIPVKKEISRPSVFFYIFSSSRTQFIFSSRITQ